MNKLLICGLLYALALTTISRAGVYLEWTITPNAATIDGQYLDKIVGTLHADTGVIEAIECGTEASPGFTGTFYQDWVLGILPTPAMDTVIGDSPEIDTHFLFEQSDLTVPPGRELGEDKDSGNPNFGTYLWGHFGITPPLQSKTIDFVQFYVPAGQGTCRALFWNFEVSESGHEKSRLHDMCPEPTMLGLVACGSIPLLLARRRKRENQSS